MYRCTVRFETRIPSLSNSPRSRSAPTFGFARHLADQLAWRVGLRPRVRDCHRHRRRKPSGATEAQWPAAPASRARHEAVHSSAADRQALRACELTRFALQPTLRSRQLLSEKLVLCHERCARNGTAPPQPTRAPSIRGSVSRGGGPGAGSARFQESSQDGHPPSGSKTLRSDVCVLSSLSQTCAMAAERSVRLTGWICSNARAWSSQQRSSR